MLARYTADTRLYFSLAEFPGTTGSFLHSTIFDLLGNDAVYLPRKSNKLLPMFEDLIAAGASGISLSMPFKTEAVAHLHSVSDSVKLAGATNTVVIQGPESIGYNTDVAAASTVLRELSPGSLLVLGAGGLGRAWLTAASLLGVDTTWCSSRSFPATLGESATLINWDERQLIPPVDVCVNATPIGLTSSTGSPWDGIRLNSKTFLVDAVVNSGDRNNAFGISERFLSGAQLALLQGVIQSRIYCGEVAPFDSLLDCLKETHHLTALARKLLKESGHERNY